MEWQIREDMKNNELPWSVYKVFAGDYFLLEKRFTSRSEATLWIQNKQKH